MDSTTTEDLAQFQGGSCSWYDLPCNFTSFIDWLFDALLFIPRKVWELLLSGLASVIEAIPVPDFFANAGATLGGIPPGVMWFAEVAQLDVGLSIILGAYVVRFLIRRLPLVG